MKHSAKYLLKNLKIFVAHVRCGYEDRAEHIEKMLGKMGLPFEYMLNGDISDITPIVFERYFKAPLQIDAPNTSCTLKHLLIYEEILKQNLDGTLVMEDDIILHKNFLDKFEDSLQELKSNAEWDNAPVIISYEDTRLRFVPHSQRHKGQLLYLGNCDRMTGCYYINRAGAKVCLDYALTNGYDRPIDLIHNHLLKSGTLKYLWCQPTIATQGSHVPKFKSSIYHGKSKIKPYVWMPQRLYKQFLYYCR